MANILEDFDFNDSKALDKLKGIADTLERIANTSDQSQKNMNEGFQSVSNNAANFETKLKGVGARAGLVGGLVAGGMQIASKGIKKAIDLTLQLKESNDRLGLVQDDIDKKFSKLKDTLGQKLAPAFHAVQQITLDWLSGAQEGAENLSDSIGIKIAASVKAVAATIGQAIKNFRNDNKAINLELKALGKQIKAVFTTNRDRAKQLRFEAKLLTEQAQFLTDQNKSLGEVFRNTFQTAKEEIADLVANGYYKLETATEEQIAQALRLKQAYEDLVRTIENKLAKSEIDNADSVKKAELERDFALQQIDLLEEKARKAAEAAGEEFDLEDEFRQLRLLEEQKYLKKLEDIRKATSKEIAEVEKKAFKEVFGVALDEVDDFGKKAVKSTEDAVLEAIKRQKEVIETKSDQILGDTDLTFAEKFKKKLLDKLLVSEEEFDFVFGQAKNFFNSFGQLLTASNNQALEENQSLIDRIRDRQSVLQNELEDELERREAGYSNDVALKRQQLAELKKEEEKAALEREKLQKRQVAIEAVQAGIQQAASLATAAANFFKSGSSLGPLGIGIAVGLISTMFSIFAKTKARAREEATISLYKGGSTKKILKSGLVNKKGRSDIPGHGRGHRVEDSNLVLGGKEFVTNEGTSQAQSEVMEEINSGKYDNDPDLIYRIRSKPDLKQYNRSFEKRQSKIIKIEKEITRDKAMERALDRTADKIIGYLKSQPTIYHEQENDVTRVEVTGTTTRKIKVDREKNPTVKLLEKILTKIS